MSRITFAADPGPLRDRRGCSDLTGINPRPILPGRPEFLPRDTGGSGLAPAPQEPANRRASAAPLSSAGSATRVRPSGPTTTSTAV